MASSRHVVPIDGVTCVIFWLRAFGNNGELIMYFSLFQLSELEQRVLEAEGRAEEAEDKVKKHFFI